MITKYYSDKTQKYYDTEKECVAAEKEYNKAHAAELKTKEELKQDVAAVQKAYDEMNAARENYKKAIDDFCKKHSGYHLTINSSNFFDLFDRFFDLF